MAGFAESEVEAAALEWLESLGWDIAHGPDIAPDTPGTERADYGAVVLQRRLRDALARLNPDLAATALDDAFRKLVQPEGATLETRNRAVHRLLTDGATVEYRDDSGAIRGAQARAIDFDDPAANDWAGGQPVHRRREQAGAAAGRGAIRQRAAARHRRAQEPGRRGRDGLDGVATAPDLQGRAAVAVRLQRGARRLGRGGGADRHADRRAGVVQAVADGHRRGAGRPAHAAIADDALRRISAAPVPRAGARLHRVRGRRRLARQDYGGISPVPRRSDGGRGDASSRRAATGSSPPRNRPLRVGPQAGRRSRRPADRRRLAHPGLGQEPDHGVLCRADRPRTGDGEPDDRRADRPQRPRRPALRHLRALPRPAAATAGAGREPGRPEIQTRGRIGRRGVHHHPEVLSGGEGRPASIAVGAPQRGGHRRRGASQPVRLHRRLRPPHAGRPAERVLRRLHRHAGRAPGRQHAGRVRRLHQHLRHPARGRGRRDGADLLREPARQAGPRRRREAQHRPRVRGSDRGRGAGPQGKAQDQGGRSWKPSSGRRSVSPWSPRTSSRISSAVRRRWMARRWWSA